MRPGLASLDATDPRLVEKIRAARADFGVFAPWLKIRPEEGGRLVPFHLNSAQRFVRQRMAEAKAEGYRKFLLLKARKLGITTLGLGTGIHLIWRLKYFNALMTAHRGEDASAIFEAGRIMDREMPQLVRHEHPPPTRQEIAYPDMGSRLGIGTAAGHGVRRGDTIQFLHMTEAARYPRSAKDTIVGMIEAARAGIVWAESTAAGASGWFYDTWMENREGGPWYCLFLPWWLDDRNVVPLTREEIGDYEFTDEEAEWAVPNGVQPEQIEWYRQKSRLLGNLMRQEYPCTYLGSFAVSGRHYFDQEIVMAMAADRPAPIESRDDGATLIWEELEEGVRYVAGSDPCEGTANGDFAYCSVHRQDTGAQVARIRARWSPARFAKATHELCEEYRAEHRRCLIGPERNMREYTRRLQVLGAKLYRRTRPGGKVDPVPGWLTDSQTRPMMLAHLKDALEGDGGEEPGWLLLRDPAVLAEMTTFEDQGKGRYEANSGHHDDGIIAVAIALQMRRVPRPQVGFVSIGPRA